MSLITQVWQQLLPYQNAKHWYIGFSGGMDSTVLLHLLHQLRQQYQLPELKAIYIHHGLQAIAESWPEHCQKVCSSFNIPLTVINVTVEKKASLEQAAREARYKAFSSVLDVNDILLTAQHQNDQAETVLFRLARGTGLKGLTGMPQSRPLSQGKLVRPLLNIPYNTLKQYANSNALRWIEDPSNRDHHYSRNYLRHEIIPKLEAYWPQVIHNISQTTRHLQEAQSLLDDLAKHDLANAQIKQTNDWLTIPSLLIEPLKCLSPAQQKNALSYWLADYTLPPTTAHWQGWYDLLHAKDSATPIWQLNNLEIHRTGGQIWLLKEHWLKSLLPINIPITKQQKITLLDNGCIELIGTLPKEPLFIRYRQGGEIIQLLHRGHRDLKRLFNEQKIPSFIRPKIPLLFNQQGTLIAIANFPQWRDKNYQQDFIFKWSIN